MKLTTVIATLATLTILSSTAVLAEDQTNGTDATSSKRCLTLQRIKSTKIIDNQHILFKMTSGPDYMNELPHRCPGLRKNEPFMYKTSLSSLCDLDFVTILQSTGGSFMKGASCGLGKFVEYDEEAAEKVSAEEQPEKTAE